MKRKASPEEITPCGKKPKKSAKQPKTTNQNAEAGNENAVEENRDANMADLNMVFDSLKMVISVS